MKKTWLACGAVAGCLTGAALAACSSSSSGTTGTTAGGSTHGATTSTTSTTSGAGGSTSTTTTTGSAAGGGGSGGTGGEGGKGGGATTTIAAARMGNVTAPITVDVVVTGLHGVPGDYSQWYIEDPAGGPSSGVAVYCDPDKAACPSIRAPAIYSLVRMTGALSTYMGQLQFVPTAQMVLMANATPPPVAMVTVADILPAANSPYRGVVVKITSTLTVDNVTPPALYDTQCDVPVVPDGGADGGDAGADAGPPFCTTCAPPTYSGFQANDGKGNEVYIEDFFFNTDHLQSSPECLTQAGVKPVIVGEAFSQMTGILNVDPYAAAQQLSPVSDADYTVAP